MTDHYLNDFLCCFITFSSVGGWVFGGFFPRTSFPARWHCFVIFGMTFLTRSYCACLQFAAAVDVCKAHCTPRVQQSLHWTKWRQMRFSWPQHEQEQRALSLLRPTAHKCRRVSIVFFVISNLPALGLAPSLISCVDISIQLPYHPCVERKLERAEHSYSFTLSPNMVKYDGVSGCLLCSVCYVHNELLLQDVI